jgi:DNA-binding IclR family transcriptional regulator
MSPESATPEVPSIGRGYGRLLDVLELLAARDERITISELARELDIPKATTSLLVQHLLAREYLSGASDRSLTVGPRFVRLGLAIAGRFTGGSYARAVVRDIAKETGLDTYLGIVVGDEVLYANKAEGRQSVRVDVALGIPRPLHCTAVGKAGLAFGPRELWDALRREAGPLRRYTGKTRVTLEELAADIADARRLGYVAVDGEFYEGHMSVAVPVYAEGDMVRMLVALGHRQVVHESVPEIVQELQAGATALGMTEQ